MAFVVGAFAVGVIVMHEDHSNHSNHRQYGDAGMVQAINDKQSEVDSLSYDLDWHRQEMQQNFDARIRELRSERNYSALGSSPKKMIDKVKEDMARELDAGIAKEKQELAEIDRMISKINELELKAKG
ncbi:MAG: hypothetical protein IJU71_10280 [Selenomonadaceae bacterium]|nr:hypothetical protein [Selenomonadaceae bacterium]